MYIMGTSLKLPKYCMYITDTVPHYNYLEYVVELMLHTTAIYYFYLVTLNLKPGPRSIYIYKQLITTT